MQDIGDISSVARIEIVKGKVGLSGKKEYQALLLGSSTLVFMISTRRTG